VALVKNNAQVDARSTAGVHVQTGMQQALKPIVAQVVGVGPPGRRRVRPDAAPDQQVFSWSPDDPTRRRWRHRADPEPDARITAALQSAMPIVQALSSGCSALGGGLANFFKGLTTGRRRRAGLGALFSGLATSCPS